MMYFAFIFSALLTAQLSEARGQERSRRIARLHAFGSCENMPMLPYHITESKISEISKHVYALNAKGVNDKETRTFEKVTVNITRCSDKTRAHCEHYNRMEWKGSAVICTLLESNGTPWESIMISFYPRLRCVNRKGPITIRNMTLNFEQLAKLNFGWSDYYISQAVFFDEKLNPWACFRSEIDYPKVRG